MRLAVLRRSCHVLADPHDLEAGLEGLRVREPVEGFDLAAGEADQGVAVAESVVHEGERMVSRQRAQPERHLGKVHGHRVPVDSVQAPLCHKAAGVDHLVLVGRNGRHLAVGTPRFDQGVGELAAGLDEERAGAHRGVADLEVEDLGRGRCPAVLLAELGEDGREGVANDGLGQLPGRVVGARAAALVVRLQHEGAGRDEVRGRILVQHAIQRRVKVLQRIRGPQRLGDGVRHVAVGMRLQPAGAPALRLCQQLVEIDGARRAELLCGLDRDRAAGRDLHPEAHDRLVHRADLLDIEGAVGDALAVEDEELLKHPVHGPVRDEGRPDALDNLPDARIGVPAFEEREPVRIENGTVALRQGDRATGTMGTCSVVDETEQDEELCPRAEALVHGVRMQGGVFTETLVEAAERVVAEEGVVLRQHAALLGVEEEDEAEDDSEEPSVDIVSVAVLGERLAKQPAAGGVVGGLEPSDELVEGVHHLLGETLAHLVLVLAAVLEESGEPLSARQREEALLGEEEAEGGAEGAPGGEAHVRDAEVHPAGALAARSGDEAKRDAVEEQAGGNPGAPEQALGTALGRGFEARPGAPPPPAGASKSCPVVECLDEELPWRLTVARVALADREVGAEGLAVVREGNLQLGRDRSFVGASVAAGSEPPAEDAGGKLAEVGDAGLRPARGVEHTLADAAGKPALPFGVLPVQDGSRLRKRRGGDHEPLRLDEAEPFEVGAGVGIGGGHARRVGLCRPAKSAIAEEAAVRVRHLFVLGGRVDLATGIRNDLAILEVHDQRCIVCVEQPRAAHQGKREDVFVVGPARVSPSDFICARIHGFVRHRPRPTNTGRCSEPSHESTVSAELSKKVTANDQLPTRTREPVEETYARRRPIISEHFVCHIGVDDSAHQRPTERRASSMKN